MAVEWNVGGTQNPCTHRTTARSAKNYHEWVCLYCGAAVPVEAQGALQLSEDVERRDGRGARTLEIATTLPKPPRRGVP